MANLTNDDLYMCKHSTVTTDKDGFTVPACTLCRGMACDVVLHYGDEGCKYEREEPHENDVCINENEAEGIMFCLDVMDIHISRKGNNG